MRALLGVSDRSGIVEFAQGLRALSVDLVATDGTRAELAKAGIDAVAVADVTGLPEMLGGRVKTLHPAIFAGILAKRDDPEHTAQLGEHGFVDFDIVAVNLYPFEETVAQGADHAAIVEKIDIGGPSLIRAAAKNYGSLAVASSPEDYSQILEELKESGSISLELRRRLAADAFSLVAAYDTAIAAYWRQELGDVLPQRFTVGGKRLHQLRYGENPHQDGALYAVPDLVGGVAHAKQWQGPELSFTNWLDVDAAYRLVCEFDQPTACIIKHTNPCGVAIASDIATAYRRAYECDPRSAFGGIVGINRPLDADVVAALGKTFLEAVIAPEITEDAAQLLSSRERLRLLEVGTWPKVEELDVRSINGGLLVQTFDQVQADRVAMNVVTDTQPTEEQWQDLLTAWKVCRHVKSNAIVIVKDGMAVGVGAGQMSRVEAAQLAVQRAGERVRGAVAASDAFFPMPDGLEMLAEAGVVAVIQPGGSKKDDDVTTAANGANIAMVHAGKRHFRH